MSAEVTSQLAVWGRRVAALGLFVLCSRFAWVTTSWALTEFDAHEERGAVKRTRPSASSQSSGEPTAANPAAPPAAPGTLVPAAPGPSGSAAPAPPPAPTTAAPVPSGPPKQRMLFVDLGPARSEVYVSGVHVGHTPYAGSWSCREGDVVVIHVLPRGYGVPIEARAACQNSMRAVEGRTLDREQVARILADPNVPGSVKDVLRR